MSTVHVVMPASVADPRRPSGGSSYDLRVCAGLRARGHDVREHLVPGAWPWADDDARRGLRAVLAALPDGATVLVDGMVASSSPDAFVPESERLSVTVVVHLPLAAFGTDHDPADAAGREREVLTRCSAVLTTSRWTRNRLLAWHRTLDPARVHVVEPGVDQAPVVQGRADHLLVVGAVTPTKGTDLLVEALALLGDRAWTCEVVGSLDVAPWYASRVQELVAERGLAGRVRFAGPLHRPQLDERYARAGVVVVPSRTESYGMVVTEALARSIPVVATAVGGVREAVGTADGEVPGLLVDAESPAALADALARWLDDATLRSGLRGLAAHRRAHLRGWDETAARIDDVLLGRAIEAAA